MRIGLQVPSFTWPGGAGEIGARFAEIGRTADEAGFDSLWVMDHFFQIEYVGAADEPMLEGYSALSFLAGVTRRARLGTMVTGAHYRHPGILVKTVTTLDVLSGGRAYLGIGAGWYERESVGLGVPFPSTSERFERLEETLRIAHQMWNGDGDAAEPFEGKHYHLAEPMNRPQALSRPRPPILVGGAGEKKTLRLVAQYADACNLFSFMGNDAIRHKLDVLKRHCDDVGRDYDEVERTTLASADLSPGRMTAEDVVSLCREQANLGIQHIIFQFPNVHEIRPLEEFGEKVIPEVAGL